MAILPRSMIKLHFYRKKVERGFFILKADPYLLVQLGKKSYKDRDNYVSKQLSPEFGRYDSICICSIAH